MRCFLLGFIIFIFQRTCTSKNSKAFAIESVPDVEENSVNKDFAAQESNTKVKNLIL